ncbi:MAG: RibD family protein [Myxococcota bacterium]
MSSALQSTPHELHGPDLAGAWQLVSSLRARISTHGPIMHATGLCLDRAGELQEVACADGWIVADPGLESGWAYSATIASSDARVGQLLDLYMPLCVGAASRRLVVAHLAQSLDGRIATNNGVSQFISGHEDLEHTHRLRALVDAVVVGASTVEHDDPRLTTRLCPGANPVRVVIDPRGRTSVDRRLVDDTEARTLIIRGAGLPHSHDLTGAPVEIVELETDDQGWLPIPSIIEALHARGIERMMIEGGGLTVSRFLVAGLVDRLHLSVSPVIIGSGRPAFTFPEVFDLESVTHLQPRQFQLGRDVLFDCPLTSKSSP